MSDTEPDLSASEIVENDPFDEVREAAGAVIASLKRLVEATEAVVEDPAAFAQIVDSGRSVFEAFVGGFAAQADPPDDDAGNMTAPGDETAPES